MVSVKAGIGLVLLAAVLIIGGTFVMNTYYKPSGSNIPIPQLNTATTQTTTSTPQGTTVTTTVTPTSWAQVTSPLEIQVSQNNQLSNAALTEGTNLKDDYWWSTNGQTFNFLGVAGTSSPYKSDFIMTPQMNGIVYIRSQIVSGQSYYVWPAAIQSYNPCITGVDFMDITNSGTPQWLFQCTLAKSGVPPAPNANAAGGGAQIPLLIYYDQALAYSAPSINSNTASSGAVSTNANTLNQVLYYISPTAATGYAIGSFELKVNGTNQAKWNEGQSGCFLPNETPSGTYSTTFYTFASAQQNYQDGTSWHHVWTTPFSAPIDTTFGVSSSNNNNNLKGASVNGAFHFATNSGVPAQIPYTCNIYTNLAATDHLDWTAIVTYITPSQGTSTTSKTVALSADGSSS